MTVKSSMAGPLHLGSVPGLSEATDDDLHGSTTQHCNTSTIADQRVAHATFTFEELEPHFICPITQAGLYKSQKT